MKSISVLFKIFSCVICIALLLPAILLSQGTAGSNATAEPRYLIDVPTAGMFPHRALSVDMNYFQNGGVLLGVSAGLFNRALVGVSFGGTNLVGAETPVWNKTIGLQARLRLLEESLMMPAILLGYDSQGKEEYLDSLGRYAIKSLGFYAVGSKNYKMLGFFSIHGGINYTTERWEEVQRVNLFAGAEKTIGPFISAVGEYNAGLNDQNENALGRGHGYLNLGLKMTVGTGFTLALNLKDVIRNQQDISIGNRTLGLEYVRSF